MAWTDQVGGGVSDAYNFSGFETATSNFFDKALGGYVQLESIKAANEASAYAQERTRNTTTQPTGQPVNYSDTGRPAAMGGITSTHLLLGGVMLAGVLLLTR